ncbi:K(+)-transporting ATPase subunit C [Flavihumibacter solisilvae]|uniref:Potassium-transporting ATPase KdpC subunit n=1 Tax=Flavihumibacter solisilvae TaxID=1349421 RepID=A0A0C1L9A4_9BACT|nr:K(+)-transporting ATPase subunit C [Flavihumibacter solisilvae]KIC96086.1 potassium-transporting ATPase subunit C [Flavihumibacter solisilvae]
MKKYLITSLKLTTIMLVLLSVIYPLFIAGVALFALGKGKGETLSKDGKVVGYENIGQSFTEDRYFWGRPSAAGYNAAGSSGSNKGPTNPEYLKTVSDRIDTFLLHNPGIERSRIPADLVTASGSGLDPDISPDGARVQVKRVAVTRHLNESKVASLVESHIEKPLLGFLGPEKINVLKLNIALDQLQ